MSRDVGSINRVFLVGHVGRNPETRVLPQTQNKVARFSLATNERTFNPTTRESKDYTEWHKVAVWGKQADFVEKYVVQGKLVLVEGKLRTRKWQDRNGGDRWTTEIMADNIILLGRREAGAAEPVAAADAGSGTGAVDYPAGGDDDFNPPAGGGPDDDIPF